MQNGQAPELDVHDEEEAAVKSFMVRHGPLGYAGSTLATSTECKGIGQCKTPSTPTSPAYEHIIDNSKVKPYKRNGHSNSLKDDAENPWKFLLAKEAAAVAATCRSGWLLVVDSTLIYESEALVGRV